MAASSGILRAIRFQQGAVGSSPRRFGDKTVTIPAFRARLAAPPDYAAADPTRWTAGDGCIVIALRSWNGASAACRPAVSSSWSACANSDRDM